MTQKEWLKLIKQKCLYCCADQLQEVARCNSVNCPLHKYRTGKLPEGEKRKRTMSAAQKMNGIILALNKKIEDLKYGDIPVRVRGIEYVLEDNIVYELDEKEMTKIIFGKYIPEKNKVVLEGVE